MGKSLGISVTSLCSLSTVCSFNIYIILEFYLSRTNAQVGLYQSPAIHVYSPLSTVCSIEIALL